MDIHENQLIQTYDGWGPNYTVEFNIKVPSILNANKVYNVLHLTNGTHQNLMFSVKREYFHISSNDGKFNFDFKYELGEKYHIAIKQTGTYLFLFTTVEFTYNTKSLCSNWAFICYSGVCHTL